MDETRPPRRKRRRKGPLPSLPEPSHIMWPGADSGYEAHPWSPAGALQAHDVVAGKVTPGQRRFVRWVLVALLVVLVVSMVLA